MTGLGTMSKWMSVEKSRYKQKSKLCGLILKTGRVDPQTHVWSAPKFLYKHVKQVFEYKDLGGSMHLKHTSGDL